MALRGATVAGALWAFANITGLTSGGILVFASGVLAGEQPPSGQFVERPLPTLGKGQQAWGPGNASQPAVMVAASTDELIRGFQTLRAGQTLEILPGTYRLRSRIGTANAGRQDAPITARAAIPGSVIIEVDVAEGFYIDQPYWIVENLLLRGICANENDCEHAFHIVGKAHHTIIRNNHSENFNAHLKINGDGNGNWPDDGVLQFSTLSNTRGRQTSRPVTPFDLVGADRWLVADNIVSNFVKGDGNRISYGIFMKGGSHGGRIERNLIVCTPPGSAPAGQRVGLSFGGGGTGPTYCRRRDQRGQCAVEHSDGGASNNIIAHCNDAGIDINRSMRIVVAHNTLINTVGIEVRGQPATAMMHGNLLEGRIRARDGGQVTVDANATARMTDLFAAPGALDFHWRKAPAPIASSATVPVDFCGRRRSEATLPGAFAELAPCPPAPHR